MKNFLEYLETKGYELYGNSPKDNEYTLKHMDRRAASMSGTADFPSFAKARYRRLQQASKYRKLTPEEQETIKNHKKIYNAD
jgi:hypothetical protein